MDALIDKPAVAFGVEELSEALWSELMPLLERHYADVRAWDDVPLSPSYATYAALARSGMLRLFTARLPDWSLAGYLCFIVTPHPACSTMVQALEEGFYVAPEHRGGTGRALLAFAEDRLRAEGVDAVSVHVSARFDFSAMLKRCGYELNTISYAKRL